MYSLKCEKLDLARFGLENTTQNSGPAQLPLRRDKVELQLAYVAAGGTKPHQGAYISTASGITWTDSPGLASRSPPYGLAICG